MMWMELDAVYDRLIEAPAEDGQDKGRAEGMALCIAILETPYGPDVNRIRRICKERRERREAPEDA